MYCVIHNERDRRTFFRFYPDKCKRFVAWPLEVVSDGAFTVNDFIAVHIDV